MCKCSQNLEGSIRFSGARAKGCWEFPYEGAEDWTWISWKSSYQSYLPYHFSSPIICSFVTYCFKIFCTSKKHWVLFYLNEMNSVKICLLLHGNCLIEILNPSFYLIYTIFFQICWNTCCRILWRTWPMLADKVEEERPVLKLKNIIKM